MLQISFGKKIPIATCQVQNNETENFEKATIYEYDCKDKSDLDELSELAEEDNFDFGHCIWAHAYEKAHPTKQKHRTISIYAMENENNETICLCHANKDNEKIILNHIESSKNKKYSYAGQNMIAMLAKQVIQANKKELYVSNILEEAREFYICKCGFETVYEKNIYGGRDVTMFKKDIPTYLQLVQDKTKYMNMTAKTRKMYGKLKELMQN